MTVSNTDNRKTYAGNGATQTFGTSPILFFATSDLDIYVVAADDSVTTLVENTHYTVTAGSGDPTPLTPDYRTYGGTVDLSTGGDPYGAPATGTTLVIVRNLPFTQASDFVNNDVNDAEVTEAALDKLTMLTQQLDERTDRSFTLADSDVSGASTELPTPEANALLGWNGAGTALENYVQGGAGSAAVSTFMATVLDDVSAAEARTTLDAMRQRTVTGTANEITVTNGDGASGNPVLSLPTALTFTGKAVTGGAFASPALTTPALGVPASGDLKNTTNSALTAGRLVRSGASGTPTDDANSPTCDASGNVVLAGNLTLATTKSLNLNAGGTNYIREVAADVLQIVTAGTERARVSAQGYLKASNSGTYRGATAAYHELRTDGNSTQALFVGSSHASVPLGMVIEYTAAAPNGTINGFLQCNDTGATRAAIRDNGGLANFSGNNVNLSAAELKTPLVPLGSYWDKWKQFQFGTYFYKDQTDDLPNIGVTADQVQAIAPELGTTYKYRNAIYSQPGALLGGDGKPLDPGGELISPEVQMPALWQTDMYMVMGAVLQEAQAKIEQLTSEFAAYKAAHP